MRHLRTTSKTSGGLIAQSLAESLRKLGPIRQLSNPVMFIAYLCAAAVTAVWAGSLLGLTREPPLFAGCVAVWLWGTVLFANFAESLAEGRAKAQADSLKSLRKSTPARRLDPSQIETADAQTQGDVTDSTSLVKGDIVLVKAGETIPCDGEVIKGIASVNESAVTGESAPVIREAGGDKSSVTGGTTLLTDWLVIRSSSDPGRSFVERMIGMVEGAERRKTPNETALTILLLTLTVVFVLVTAALLPMSGLSVKSNGQGTVVSVTALAALLVCLIPTTIGALLSAVGVAGMSRLLSANVIARSGRAVEAAGDVDILLLDKTGTITYGNRRASGFYPAPGVTMPELLHAAALSSLADDTPEGKSIVRQANELLGPQAVQSAPAGAVFIAFTAQTRMSGIGLGDRRLLKGAADAICRHVRSLGSTVDSAVLKRCDQVAGRGSTPLLICDDARMLGVIELKDVLKPGIREQFNRLRAMGIKSVMVTGDNTLTAAAIAGEAGVDDYLAEATPETKLERIRRYQSAGHLVAMTGDGTNDAPALAQADVAVAMNSGTQAAKEAANMVDLDSSPGKLIDVVRIGKQMLMTRGALTTFSIANDAAKYFAVIPAVFAGTYPGLEALNVMQLATPSSALLSAVIFNALIIVALIPLALRGVTYRPAGAAALLRKNLLVYGLGGLIAPFVGIKLIDAALATLGLF